MGTVPQFAEVSFMDPEMTQQRKTVKRLRLDSVAPGLQQGGSRPASGSPGNLLEVGILGPHPRPARPETLPSNLPFTVPLRWFWSYTLRFEKACGFP